MIGIPFDDNDLNCLGWLTEVIISLLDPPHKRLIDTARQFQTVEDAAAWIRGKPQRNDDGIPGDGWKLVACRPAQRLEILSETPNCFERTADWMLLAELIDPRPIRRLATIDYSWGRHTFPIQDGVPIVLDPRVTFDELLQATPRDPVESTTVPAEPPSIIYDATTPESTDGHASATHPNAGVVPPSIAHGHGEHAGPSPFKPPATPIVIDVGDAITFTSELAQQAAASTRNGPSRAYAARNAIQAVVNHGTVPTDPRALESIGWFLSLAERMATDYGPRALRIVRTTALAISDLIDDLLAQRQHASHARNLSFSIGGASFGVPSWLTDVGAVVGKVGLKVGAAALAPNLASLGVSGKMLELVEQELNAEGLSLAPPKDSKRSPGSSLQTKRSA